LGVRGGLRPTAIEIDFATMTLTLGENHKKDFDRDGFVLLEGVLDPPLVGRVRSAVVELAKWEADCGVGHFYSATGKSQRVWNLINKGQIFRELIVLPVILDFMEWIFRRDTIHQKYLLSSFQANILLAGEGRQKVHIDTPVPEPLPPWPIKANTIWLLDEFTAQNGATEVLPGSHTLSHKPSASDQTRGDLTTVVAPAGSILVTHGALWHRSGENTTDRERIALLGSFAASYAREIANEEDYGKVLDPAVVAGLSPALRAILAPDHGIKPGARNPPKS
jgi:hypothetical protein